MTSHVRKFVVRLRWQGGEVGRRQKDYLMLGKNPFNGKIFLSLGGHKDNWRFRAKREPLSGLSVWLLSKFDKAPFEGYIASCTAEGQRTKTGKAQLSHIPVLSEFEGVEGFGNRVMEIR